MKSTKMPSPDTDQKPQTRSALAVDDASSMSHHDAMMMHDNTEMAMSDAGHGSMDSMARPLRRRLIMTLILLAPLFLLAPLMGLSAILKLPNYYATPLVMAIGSVIFFYGGWPFLKGGLKEIRAKRPAMMLLITLGISVAYVYSMATGVKGLLLRHGTTNMAFWFELASLIAIMLAGHLIEMNAGHAAGDALTSLAELLPKKAHKIKDGAKLLSQTDDIELASVKSGDVLLVRDHEKIPADGRVLDENSFGRQAGSEVLALVDESMVTGESRPVAKTAQATVFAGSLNQNRAFKMVVTNTGSNAYLAQIGRLVVAATAQKSRAETLADRVAGWLFWFALFFAAFAFSYWSFYVGVSASFAAAVATLVVACPHALGLAIPLVAARLMRLSARRGLFIQNRTALENAPRLRYALLDKTGTLTDGHFSVREVVDFPIEKSKRRSAHKKSKILPMIASLESGSTHPLGMSIVDFYKAGFMSKNDKNPKKLFVAEQKKFVASHVETMPGVGVNGVIAKEKYLVVSLDFVREHNLKLKKTDLALAQQHLNDGLTLCFLLRESSTKTKAKAKKRASRSSDYEVLGFVALGDRIKDDARRTVRELLARGVKSVMVTGDNVESAQKVAHKLGIHTVRAGLSPADKASVVRKFQRKGKVLFVGDGVNDAPALAAADLSLAVGAGTAVAIDSADVVLANSHPSDILKLLRLADASNRKMKQNLWWGAGYNLLAVPLAAFGILNPILAGIFMSASTIIVMINANSLHDSN